MGFLRDDASYNAHLINIDRDASKTCLDYILRRSKLPFLPAARDDKNVLTSEEKMLRDRHTTYVEYLVTGGKGKDAASQSDRAEIENLSQQVNDIQGASTLIIHTQIGHC